MVNSVPRRQDRPESCTLRLKGLPIYDVQLALVGPVLEYLYVGIMGKEIGYPTSMVLVPVCDKYMRNRDVMVFEISGDTQCPLRGSLLTIVITLLGEKMKMT